MSVQLPEQASKLLDADTFVTMTTLAKDGSPHSTVVWAERDGDDVIVSTVVGRVKERHLRRDPRVSISFFDAANPYSYVTIRGTATLTTEGGPELIQRLSQKYTGGPYRFDEGTDNVRVIVRVTPEQVYAQ